MCDQCGCGRQIPPRTAPVEPDPGQFGARPAHLESGATLDRRFRDTGSRTLPRQPPPARLPSPPNGNLHTFESRQALVAHFRGIDARGNLYNTDPIAFRAAVTAPGGGGVMTPLEAWSRAALHIQTAPEHFTYLLEQTPLSSAIMAGIGMAGRSHTGTPPESRPIGHNVAAGAHGQAMGNAVGLGLDYLASISIAIAERIHHAVVVYQPPGSVGGSWDPRRGSPYHFVLFRPLGLRDGQLGLQPWTLTPPSLARQYLQ